MANKITKDTMKRLIEQVMKEGQLSEKMTFNLGKGNKNMTSFKPDEKSKLTTKQAGVTSAQLQALAGVDGKADLTVDDFGNGLKKRKSGKINGKDVKAAKFAANHLMDYPNTKNVDDQEIGTAYNDISGAGQGFEEPEKFTVGTKAQAKKGLDVYDPDSIAFGQMANAGMQSPDDPVGAIQLGIGTAMKEFFGNKTTFKSRIDAISTFTKDIFVNGSIPTDKRELLRATLVADYLSTIVKEVDSGSGAYQFESFLAAMAGGSVVGKGDISGTGAKKGGKMGAVDFVTVDGSFGSAKYYASGNSLTQAMGGFKNKKDKTTLYIIAIKKSEHTGIKVDSGTDQTTSKPADIQVLDIYMVSVMPTEKNPKSASDFKIQINGEDQGTGKIQGGNQMYVQRSIKKGKKEADDVTTTITSATPIKLYITGTGDETLKEKLAELTKADSTDLGKAYIAFQDLFKNLYAANQNAQAYASSGDKTKGNEALSTLETSDDQLVNLVKLITQDTGDTYTDSTRKIAEQKITANFLKKLIEESFKK
jgi:hypothetical protein